MKKFLSWILAAALLLGAVPSVFAAEETGDTKSLIAQQVRAFAASIDKAGADDDAAWALAKHGTTGRGKKLAAGQNHALTATLMNSELALSTLINGCAAAILVMEQMDLDHVFDDGGCYWGTSEKYGSNRIFPTENTGGGKAIYNVGTIPFTEKGNTYDDSLIWMAGSMEIHSHIDREMITEENVTYRVSVTFEDRFDFNTSSGSVPRELASLLGSFLFKEFDWTAKAEFSLTVPNNCDHDFDAYHWYYEAETNRMLSDEENGFSGNKTAFVSCQPYGDESRYFALEETLVLRHDVPWEMEFTVKHPGSFAISPSQKACDTAPYLLLQERSRLLYQLPQLVNDRVQYLCHGYVLYDIFHFTAQDSFTVSLENRISENGSNMIYVSVFHNGLQEFVLESMPMDDRYRLDGGLHLEDTESRYLSGQDLRISYIGNATWSFGAEEFDLKVWENGKNVGKTSAFALTSTTDPSCTSQGSTTYTCSLCHAVRTETVPALGHTPGAEATCTEPQTCTVCKEVMAAALGHAETEIPATEATCEEAGSTAGKKCADCHEVLIPSTEIPALGHHFYAGSCTRCAAADPDFLPGDANGDRKLDYMDALLILRASIGLESLSEESVLTCDLNKNGKPDYNDALQILRTSIGL